MRKDFNGIRFKNKNYYIYIGTSSVRKLTGIDYQEK